MRILLGSPRDVDLQSLLPTLKLYEMETIVVSFDGSGQKLPSAVDLAVLIHPSSGLIAIGEHVTGFRRGLKEGIPLIVACPQLKPSDRKVILQCGASALITPASWRSAAIAERILAELIAGGEIQPSSLGSLLGCTEPMQKLYRELQTFARLAEPVLILGETGSGKELVARELHRCSGRSGTLLAINCAALTPELVESELFGHERGAFSGAVSSRKGLLVEAGQGTVFLDEIGDLAPTSQAKLLRVLEERKVRPVGGNHWHPVHARIVLATHRDLDGAAQSGAFRQDLYERIRGFTLRLCPLRERKADLVLLCRHFVEEYNRDYSGSRTIPDGALDPLFRYSWPGNVRELRQTVRRAAAFADGDDGPISVLSLIDVAQRTTAATSSSRTVSFDPAVDTWHAVQERARAQYFRALLQECGGNKEVAAKRAGISRSVLYEILKQIGQAEHAEEDSIPGSAVIG
jgi:DNA-binding NtrC family response regulator